MSADADAIVRLQAAWRGAAVIAVTKTVGADRILPLLRAGHRLFGENRVQEAAGKWPALKAAFPDLTLRLIGPLQTNKVNAALALFDSIDTLDRESLARALAKRQAEGVRLPQLLMQVNIGEEPQKAGVAPAEAEGFHAWATRDLGLAISGLMGLPPAGADPAPHFARLRALRDRLGLPILSMGMSGDYETAIAHGATHIRLGSALFGARA